MNTKNDGGPAFPIPLQPGQGWQGMAPCDGMTLRDYFAAKAMQVDYTLAKKYTDPDWRYGIALDAYKMADAMLKARGDAP